MELMQLKYFKTLAECGNLTQTAKSLYVSPPAVSVSISKLEEELGIPLFTRVGGRMYLNDQGALFLRAVSESLESLSAGCIEARESARSAGDHFSLATSNQLLWGEPLTDFLRAYPQIRITQQELRLAEMRKAAANMQYDFFLTASDSLQDPDLEQLRIYGENEVLVCLPKDHPLANRKQIRVEELKDEAFLLPPGSQGLSAFYRKLCRDAGFEPYVRAECRFVLRARLLQAGLGIMFITRRTGGGFLPDIVTVPVEGGRFIDNAAQSLYWNRKRALPPAALAFQTFIVSYYTD